MPIEAHAIPNARRKHFDSGAIGPHPINHTMTLIETANVARRAYRNVKHSIRTEGNELPAVMAVPGEFIVHHNRLWRILQLRFNVVIPRDPENFRDVERSVPESNAGRHLQTFRN